MILSRVPVPAAMVCGRLQLSPWGDPRICQTGRRKDLGMETKRQSPGRGLGYEVTKPPRHLEAEAKRYIT